MFELVPGEEGGAEGPRGEGRPDGQALERRLAAHQRAGQRAHALDGREREAQGDRDQAGGRLSARLGLPVLHRRLHVRR